MGYCVIYCYGYNTYSLLFGNIVVGCSPIILLQ